MTIEIEKGVPIPPQVRVGRKATYPFREMQLGDSFFVPGKTTTQFSAHRVSSLKKLGLEFVSRTVVEDGVEGCRVWRVK